MCFADPAPGAGLPQRLPQPRQAAPAAGPPRRPRRAAPSRSPPAPPRLGEGPGGRAASSGRAAAAAPSGSETPAGSGTASGSGTEPSRAPPRPAAIFSSRQRPSPRGAPRVSAAERGERGRVGLGRAARRGCRLPRRGKGREGRGGQRSAAPHRTAEPTAASGAVAAPPSLCCGIRGAARPGWRRVSGPGRLREAALPCPALWGRRGPGRCVTGRAGAGSGGGEAAWGLCQGAAAGAASFRACLPHAAPVLPSVCSRLCGIYCAGCSVCVSWLGGSARGEAGAPKAG